MAGSGTDSRVRLNVLWTFLPAVRTSFLFTTFLWCLGAILFVIVPLGAQAISGTLVEAETGAPVEGASIMLLSRDGEQLDWRLTNAAGRFDFQTPGRNSERLGRKIRFHGLPDGTWIVREWYIRRPLLQAYRGRRRPRLIGLKEEGGVVLRVDNLNGDPVLGSGAGIIEEPGLED